MVKKPYPRNRDIGEAIIAVLAKNPLLHPADLYLNVVEELERRGFYAGLVTEKRVWRVYEEMVRKGEMYDVLDVVTRKR